MFLHVSDVFVALPGCLHFYTLSRHVCLKVFRGMIPFTGCKNRMCVKICSICDCKSGRVKCPGVDLFVVVVL